MKKFLRSAVAAVLLLSLLILSLAGCGTEISAECISDGFSPRAVEDAPMLSSLCAEISEFALRLFGEVQDSGENSVVSPASVIVALAMAANGADGKTLAEMEEVLATDTDTLNLYLKAYAEHLTAPGRGEVTLANSLWLKDSADFIPNEDFLQRNADYYGADIYKAPFNRATLRDINLWIKEATNGRISNALDEIPDIAIAYLVNAIAFEAKWLSVYEKHDVRDGIFYNSDGGEARVDFMYSTEGRYLQSDLAAGFMKSYEGGKFSFAALLPKEGTTTEELIASISGKELNEMLANPTYTPVETKMPKFKAEFSAELSEVLKGMGISDAFDRDNADFSRLGKTYRPDGTEGVIFISRVLHKAYIEVGEQGTKAGAVTVVEMSDAGSSGPMEEPKVVYLDRPFVYMLIDNESKIPFFIGAVNNLG